MAPRLELQTLLETLLGSRNVYFQPPPSITLKYPCIVYKRNNVRTDFADNTAYKRKKSYQVMVIDKNPDSIIPDKVLMLPLCSYDRFYAADNLHHDVYTLFF